MKDLRTHFAKGTTFLCSLIALALCESVFAQQTANPLAIPQARALLEYFEGLKSKSDSRLVSGQFEGVGDNSSLFSSSDNELVKVYNLTGEWPAIIGFRWDRNNIGGAIEYGQANDISIEHHQNGGLVHVTAAARNPWDQTQMRRPVDLDDFPTFDLALLLHDGPRGQEYIRYYQDLDTIADGLKELQNEGVPVLFRPLPEMNHIWFWWSSQPADKYIQLWREMFDYYTYFHELDNLLWIFEPFASTDSRYDQDVMKFYPGDGYVDIVGYSAYIPAGEPLSRSSPSFNTAGYDALVAVNKPFGFAQWGPVAGSVVQPPVDNMKLVDGVKTDFPETVFFCTWHDHFSISYHNNASQLMNDSWVVNRDDLPAFNTFTLKNEASSLYLRGRWGGNGTWDNGDEIVLYDQPNWPNHKWSLESDGDGSYYLRNQAAELYLWADKFSDGNSIFDNGDLAKLRQLEANWGSMRWNLIALGDGWYQLKLKWEDFNLQAFKGSNSLWDNLDPIKIFAPDASWASQTWLFEN